MLRNNGTTRSRDFAEKRTVRSSTEISIPLSLVHVEVVRVFFDGRLRVLVIDRPESGPGPGSPTRTAGHLRNARPNRYRVKNNAREKRNDGSPSCSFRFSLLVSPKVSVVWRWASSGLGCCRCRCCYCCCPTTRRSPPPRHLSRRSPRRTWFRWNGGRGGVRGRCVRRKGAAGALRPRCFGCRRPTLPLATDRGRLCESIDFHDNRRRDPNTTVFYLIRLLLIGVVRFPKNRKYSHAKINLK